MYLTASAEAELARISNKKRQVSKEGNTMNWKALLPAAALLVLLAPSAAFSRNHHYYGNISQNGMMGNGAYYGGNPMASAGINPYAVAPVAPPVANVGAFGMNALANNYNYGNGMYGYNGMMNGMNGMCGHHRRHRRRGLLQSLLNQNGGYGYGNMGNGYGYGYGNGMMGNGYGYGYGNGLTGGIRTLLNRI